MPAFPSSSRQHAVAANCPPASHPLPPAAQRFHSSSNYVRRVAEDVVFANDSSFKFDRALPVPTTSGSMQAGLSLHVMAAVAVAVWVLLA